MNREQTARWRSSDAQALLDDEGEQKDGEDNSKCDRTGLTPLPQRAAKCQSNLQNGKYASEEEGTQPVNSSKLLHGTYLGFRVVRGEEKKVDRRTDCGQRQIDVESPSPGCRADCKASTNDRTEDTACAPTQTDQGVVDGLFFLAGEGRYVGQSTVERNMLAPVQPPYTHTDT